MKLIKTLILVLALTGSAYAGDIQNAVTAPPPQAPATQPATTSETAQAPTVTEIVLTVVSISGLL